jgi:hypothetical protein
MSFLLSVDEVRAQIEERIVEIERARDDEVMRQLDARYRGKDARFLDHKPLIAILDKLRAEQALLDGVEAFATRQAAKDADNAQAYEALQAHTAERDRTARDKRANEERVCREHRAQQRYGTTMDEARRWMSHDDLRSKQWTESVERKLTECSADEDLHGLYRGEAREMLTAVRATQETP